MSFGKAILEMQFDVVMKWSATSVLIVATALNSLGYYPKGANTVFGRRSNVVVCEYNVERVEFNCDQCCAGFSECRRIDHQTFFLI